MGVLAKAYVIRTNVVLIYRCLVMGRSMHNGEVIANTLEIVVG